MLRDISKILLLFILSMAYACDKDIHDLEEDVDVVARIESKKLYENELSNIIHPAINSEDSAALANGYIDQWVRDQLMMKEALKFFAADLEIEKLVEDYRGKLIKFNFENKIIEERFDTIISDDELTQFYNSSKEQFVLKDPLLRCNYAKINKRAKGVTQFRNDWISGDSLAIIDFLSKNGIEQALDDKRWYTWHQIENWSTDFSSSRARAVINQRFSDKDFEYFLKVIEFKKEKEISPLPFIKDQLKQMILHKRKQGIIENYENELYDKALKSNLIKIGKQ